ncbi:hypothetical protein FKM82_010445 [Ascaphus truei]
MRQMQLLVLSQLFISCVLGRHVNKEFYEESFEDGDDETGDKTGMQALESESRFTLDFTQSSMLAFVPARSCHVLFKEDFGIFSPPVYHGNVDINIWCNWTVWAGSSKHIVVYIKGFTANVNCDENNDEIIFEGVSSTVENTVAYACWNQNTHVFATQALALHIVFLWRSFSRISSSKYFEGKYYIFEDNTTGLIPEPQKCLGYSKTLKESMSISSSMPLSAVSLPVALNQTT